MKVVRGLGNLRAMDSPTVVTIGVFDGVHIGHRAIIERCVERAAEIGALAVVVTFDPMPLEIIDPENAPSRITTREQQKRYISKLGADVLLLLGFDRKLADVGAAEFVRAVLSRRLNTKMVVIGEDFRFGRDREGDASLLEEIVACDGVTVESVELVRVEGTAVSSTRIRELLCDGEIETAANLLGRFPVVAGRVKTGAGRGRLLGYPTANIEVENEGALPCNGVYAAVATIGDEEYPSVVNIGVSPTFKDDEKVEFHVHILGFYGNIYGNRIEVELRRRLRDERAFESESELKAQIERDIDLARRPDEQDGKG